MNSISQSWRYAKGILITEVDEATQIHTFTNNSLLNVEENIHFSLRAAMLLKSIQDNK